MKATEQNYTTLSRTIFRNPNQHDITKHLARKYCSGNDGMKNASGGSMCDKTREQNKQEVGGDYGDSVGRDKGDTPITTMQPDNFPRDITVLRQ